MPHTLWQNISFEFYKNYLVFPGGISPCQKINLCENFKNFACGPSGLIYSIVDGLLAFCPLTQIFWVHL